MQLNPSGQSSPLELGIVPSVLFSNWSILSSVKFPEACNPLNNTAALDLTLHRVDGFGQHPLGSSCDASQDSAFVFAPESGMME